MKSPQFDDPRYVAIIGFLAAKGLLYAPKVKAVRRAALTIRDAVWVGDNLEPRVLEVLPAAVLHFPSAFGDLERMPKDLAKVIGILRSGSMDDAAFRGVGDEKVRAWANKPLRDARVKPCDEKKILRTFRLSRKCIALLNEEAERRNLTNTEVLERMIFDAGRGEGDERKVKT